MLCVNIIALCFVLVALTVLCVGSTVLYVSSTVLCVNSTVLCVGSCSWYEYLYQAVCRHPSPAVLASVPPPRSSSSAAPQSMEMSAARKEIFRMTNGLSAAPATWPAPARGAVAVSTLWSRTTGYGHLPTPALPCSTPLPRHGLHIHLSRQPAARAPLERICGHSVLETTDYTGRPQHRHHNNSS